MDVVRRLHGVFANTGDSNNLKILVEFEDHSILAAMKAAPSGKGLTQLFRTACGVFCQLVSQLPGEGVLDVLGQGLSVFQSIRSELDAVVQLPFPERLLKRMQFS